MSKSDLFFATLSAIFINTYFCNHNLQTPKVDTGQGCS